MEKIKALGSEDIVANNIETLKELFPTIFSEGKLVVEELQALLGNYVEKDKEFYQMTWAGKTQAQKEANKISTGTLRPNKAESKDWDTTGNIFIEGDNLEVLKLLQKTYSNKIKMIYIDPPYNTGKDFVYRDNYKDNLSNYLEITGQTDDEGKKLSTNTDSDGRYHSNWLNMMYPRLKLARNLMTDDGVIFISIDDNEQSNLKKICDEIFGEENFRNFLLNRRRVKSLNVQFAEEGLNSMNIGYEFVLVYSKSALFSFKALRKDKENIPSKGSWNVFWSGADRPTMRYEILGFTPISGQWRWSKEKALDAIENYINYMDNFSDKYSLEEYWKMTGEKLKFIRRIDNGIGKNGGVQYFVPPSATSLRTSNWTDIEVSQIHKEIDLPFENPKSTKLIKTIIDTVDDNKFHILDFFSGSGTTAHAVMALNAEDGGDRKCISVQLPEPTDEKSEAYKAGYKTIADITKERIRRAGELVKQENKDKEGIDKLDVGFRAFKLDSSNIQAWDTSVEKFEGQLDVFLANNGDSIKAGRTEEDVLFEILLKYGLDLTLPIQEKQIDGCTIYNIGFGAMYICLSDRINTSVAVAIGEWHKDSSDTKPSVIFKDAGFANDAAKTNTVQTLRQAGIENVKSI